MARRIPADQPLLSFRGAPGGHSEVAGAGMLMRQLPRHGGCQLVIGILSAGAGGESYR
jgi:hypothetical protein